MKSVYKSSDTLRNPFLHVFSSDVYGNGCECKANDFKIVKICETVVLTQEKYYTAFKCTQNREESYPGFVI